MSQSTMATDIDTNTIKDFLEKNPQFFQQYPDCLLHVELPQDAHGRTVSLAQHQMAKLREKNNTLSKQVQAFIHNSHVNKHAPPSYLCLGACIDVCT